MATEAQITCFVSSLYPPGETSVPAYVDTTAAPDTVDYSASSFPLPVLGRQGRFVQIPAPESNLERPDLWIDIIDVDSFDPEGCLTLLPENFVLGCESMEAGIRGSSSCQYQ